MTIQSSAPRDWAAARPVLVASFLYLMVFRVYEHMTCSRSIILQRKMAEDGNLQQETDGQNLPTSSIDGNRSQDEAQEQEPAERLTESDDIELRLKKWDARQKELAFNLPVIWTHQGFYEAVRKGDLDAVKKRASMVLVPMFPFPMPMLRTRFTEFEANAFQVATVAGQKEMFRELIKIVNDFDPHTCVSMLKEKNNNGETILTLAVAQGNIEIVKELVETCVELVDIPNKKGELPVTVAALIGKKKIVTILFKLTLGMLDLNPSGGDVEEDVVVTNSTQPSQGVSEDRDQAKPAYQSRHHGFRLFKACIRSKIYDKALEVFKMFPIVCIKEMAKEDGKTMNSLVMATIELQEQRNFITRFLESCLARWGKSCKLCSGFERYWKFLLVRTAKSWYETNYEQPKSALSLLVWICDHMSRSEISDEIVQRVLTKPFLTAMGQADATFTDTIGFFDSKLPSDMISLINPVTGVLGAIHGERNGNTILHLAAMLSSAKKLSRFPSPSLQMQSEMQRFKNAEKIVPMCKAVENNDNLTPMDLFVERHRELKNDGEKWLKETASSCSLLAMLIVTVMFSAAFTVPGGYENDTGRPVYMGSKYLTVFIISDALSLLFSSTSAMVFLGIYTSLFREEDFLKRLPITLICGLFTLFLSITTMVIAFSAALILTLREDFVWITLPVLMSASIPVIIYSVLNIPIFVHVLYSTLFRH
ncbi:uncharacterized protein LOC127794772 [Diospyros lotus]|uniref:uncharacterized protein LOC127794772 n=1 Tax=Diospyros lotus TaxID=55363 RepID=UPI0022575A61|nr:uncharacterized protein LOC127794772 [Diospyros lotus]